MVGWALLALLQVGPVQQVDGRVVRPSAKALVPVAAARVTLHRVGPDTAGPVDSALTDPKGRFHFSYHRTGSSEAIYFVSSMYDGVAYFSQPLKTAAVSGDDGEITVFDTTSVAVPMTVRGRHLVVSAPGADGRRTVIEVYEISNDSSLTVIAPGGAIDRPTWSAILPSGIEHFQVGQGDVAADAITATNGRVAVFAPFAPGVKQLSYEYALPANAFPLRMPLERPTQVLEVLVEEPTMNVQVAGLHEVNPVAVQGRTFRRFIGQDLAASTVIDVAPPPLTADTRSLYFAILVSAVGVAMLIALGRGFGRRAPVVLAARPLGDPGVDRLAGAIADLDDGFARRPTPSESDRAAYAARRAALKAELSMQLKAGRAVG
jgi:hypothetical protein